MAYVFRSLLFLLPLFTCLLPIAGEDLQKLPRSLQQDVEQTLIPAIHQNDLPVVVKTARTLLRRAGTANITQLNAYLNSIGLPDCGSLLLNARMTINDRKPNAATAVLGRTTTAEARSIIEALNARLGELAAVSSQERTVSSLQRTAATFNDYALFLRDVYRTGRSQQEIIRLCDFATQFVESEKGLLSRISDPEFKAVLSNQRFVEKRTHAGTRYDELVATELEIRRHRLQTACDVLASPDAESSERFVAAFPARLDAMYLPQALPDQAETLRPLVDQAKQDAGDLWEKSYRFHVGLAWWRRGRFGRGQYAGGMMKGFDALRSLDQQIALRMPNKFPEATRVSPSAVHREQYPLSRRHKYHWRFEPPKGAEFLVKQFFG